MPVTDAVDREATDAKTPPADNVARAVEQLRARFGDRLSTSMAVREHHGKDVTYGHHAPPDAVVFPHTTEEVAEIARICDAEDAPMVPYGAGTSLEGHIAALRGGVSIDLSAMDQVLEVNADDLDCRVQAGVHRKALNEYLRDTGLFFPIDPGADATIGGMAATRASGTNAVRYGTMRENVLGLTIVTADGRIVRTGGRARKSSAGYDLTRLLVGSEGTLGVITEIQLRLYGQPEAISAAVCPFDDLHGAVNAVIQTIQIGVPVARIELLDQVQMMAINRYSYLSHPERPTLFFEFHGSLAGVAEQAETVGAIVAEHGGGPFNWTTKTEDRSRLWQARHDAYWAAKALRPGCEGIATDVCVPISKLADCLLETRQDIDKTGLVAPIVGHVGDGNFHVVFIVDPNSEDDLRRAHEVNERMVNRAIAMGGTCTGEHGIGVGKIPFLIAEHGDALPLMRAVKQALDPKGLMNPGKIVPL